MTKREERVFQELAWGKSNKAIAYDMGIPESVVKTHAHNLFKKLGVTNRVAAALKFHGIEKPKDSP